MYNIKKMVSMWFIILLFTTACSPQDIKSRIMHTDTLSAEASPSKKTLTLYTAYYGEDVLVLDYAIQKLKELHPYIEIEIEPEIQDDGLKLKSYAATGQLPDIFRVTESTIEIFKKSNNIFPLNEYIHEEYITSLMHNSYKHTVLDEDGNIYAIPYLGQDIVLWYYNKEIFEKYNLEVPTTFKELEEVITVLKKHDIIPLSIFAKEKWPTATLYDLLVTRLEPRGIKKLAEGRASMDDPAYSMAAETLSHLVNIGLVDSKATSMNYDEAAQLFYEGKAAMFINGHWEIPYATKALGDKVDYMYPPSYSELSYEESKYIFSGGNGISGLAVSSDTKDPQLAVRVAYILTYFMAEGRYIISGNPISPYIYHTEPVEPFPPMTERLLKDMDFIELNSSFSWSLRDANMKYVIENQTQKLIVPSYSVDRFSKEIQNVISNKIYHDF